jgi:uncharacterized membrane protein
MFYLGLKLFHIAAVILFLGNIITGLYWKAHADRTRNPQVIAHTFEGIICSDRWFTDSPDTVRFIPDTPQGLSPLPAPRPRCYTGSNISC